MVGACNRFAYAVAWDVAGDPAKEGYNPLYIYGGVGLGKTHLMHAIENRIRQIHPENKILYTTSERFCNDFINAVFDVRFFSPIIWYNYFSKSRWSIQE